MKKKAVIHSDGASSGNPGHSGIGVVVGFEGRTIEISEHIGMATNNIAEYSALIRGLKEARALKADVVEAYLDAELVVKQINGEYKVKNPRLRELSLQVHDLLKSFHSFTINHVRREMNKDADRLAKKGATPETKATNKTLLNKTDTTSTKNQPGLF